MSEKDRLRERKRILRYIAWYSTPQSGVIDEESLMHAKPEIDRLRFQLASIDSGVEINARPWNRGVGRSIKEKRSRDSGPSETEAILEPSDE